MDFGLSEEQRLLEETTRSWLASRMPIEEVRARRAADRPNDREFWRAFAELGAAGILIPEDRGGSGLTLLDAALVSQSLGHAVAPSPFLSSSVLAAVALGSLVPPQSTPAQAWLSGIATGDLVFGVGFTELFSVREEAGVDVEAGRLVGKTMMALDACEADRLLVALDSETLAVLPRATRGVETTRLRTTDATRCTAEIVFDGAEPEWMFTGAGPAIERALTAARIALAADTLGACEAMIEQAVRYAGQRRQFDRLIGSFQAVKHMCAEMVADLEPARSLLWYAAHAFDALPEEAPLMACHVLAHVSEIGREIASVSTQVHGGVGWTDEQNLHFWFKRISVARHLLGGPEALRARAASLQSFDVAS